MRAGRATALVGRVLVVEDDPSIASLLSILLEADGHHVEVVHDGDDAVTAAVARPPDVVVLDVSLPGRSGLDVCTALRAEPRTRGTIILLVTALGRRDDRLRGFDAGADDYITKPFDPVEVQVRVAAAVGRSRELRDVSPLSGLPGNRTIEAELARAIADPDPPFAFVHADVDGFKSFNDRYGFLRGDEALTATAAVLLDAVAGVTGRRRFVGHIGGDDFVVIVDAVDASALCDRAVAGFDAMAAALYDVDDRASGGLQGFDRRGAPHFSPVLTLSLGVVTSEHRRFVTTAEVASAATEVKAQAKAQPGSTWRVDRRRPA